MKRVISSCIYFFVGICLQLITGLLGQTQCQLPAHFNQTVWRDSRKGLLTFTSTTMTGWEFRYGTALTEENPTWNCHANSTSGLDTTLVFKSSSTITVLQQYQQYLCMRLTKITDHSYYYYLAWVEEPRLNYERVASQIPSTVISNPLTQLCLNNTQSLLPDHEYHIMIKSGFEINAMQYCPPSFYGVYNYTVKDLDGGQTYCGNGNGRWDVCSDHQRMKFNYTSCSTPIAYSPTGNVFCVYERTGGSNIVFTVYSQDSETFSCFMASTASDGSLKVSQALGSCTKTQTPTLQPTLTNGMEVGMNMELKPIVLCPITTTSSTTTNTPATVTESSRLSAGAAAGISIGIIALIATAVLFICLYLKCRSKHGQRAPPPAKSSEKGKHTFSVPSFACIAKLCKNGSEPKEPQNGAVSPRSLNYDMERTLSNITEVSEREENPQDTNISYRQVKDISTKHTAKASLQTKLVETLKENDTVSPNGQMFTDISKQNLSADISVSQDEVIAIDKKALDNNDENIEVTRLVENKTRLSKDVPFVNSIENIFQEYDAAMSYASSMTHRSKTESELTPSMSIRRRKDKKAVNVVKPFGEKTRNSLELLSSKTESHIKMSRRKHPSRLHKSEFNIIHALKKESQTLARKSHLKKSFSRSNSLEWNFEYVSPYAMTPEQKEALIERKRKLHKRKEHSEKKKMTEKEKREKECAEAYEKWLQKKKELKNSEQSD